MMQSVTIEDLKKIIALSELSDEHLQWILSHSEYRELVDGDLIAKYGEPADWMWIILEGKIAFYMYINGRQVYFYTFENNNLTGGIGGVMPYSRMKTYPGYSYALGEVKLIGINRRDFPELEQLSADFSQKLIAYMTERARIFATTQLQHEKVNALGNLAAGIAHEMNNPAAAIKGISNELTKRLNRNYELTKKLLDCNITPEHLQHIRSLVKEKDSAPADTVKWTTLQRMENEDDIEDWLAENGIA
ncbi:MAG TPA: hypothetical protein VM843_05700, partial [Flavisolibacter sp.]|nr:hypothetical protein [Flavisolibacter sp.]